MWWMEPPGDVSAAGAGSTEGSCNAGVSPSDGPPLGPLGGWAGLVSGSPNAKIPTPGRGIRETGVSLSTMEATG